MNSPDQRKRHGEEDDRVSAATGVGYTSNGHAGSGLDVPGQSYRSRFGTESSKCTPIAFPSDTSRPEFTLLVAGCRGGDHLFIQNEDYCSTFVPCDQAKPPSSACSSTPATFPLRRQKSSLPPWQSSFKDAADIPPTLE